MTVKIQTNIVNIYYAYSDGTVIINFYYVIFILTDIVF